jgi:hypothetical protein
MAGNSGVGPGTAGLIAPPPPPPLQAVQSTKAKSEKAKTERLEEK